MMRIKIYKFLTLLLFVFLTSSCTQSEIITESERAYLNNSKSLKIGIYIYYPPDVFINDRGEINGILIDYFNLLESKINHKFQKKYYTQWQSLLDDVKAKKIDAVLEIQKTDERQKYLEFTNPIFSGKHVLIANINKELSSMESLNGKKVTYVNDYAVGEYISRNYPKVKLSPQDNEEACFDALAKGEVDAFASKEFVAKYYMSQKGVKNMKTQFYLDYENRLGIGVNKENSVLFEILNKGNNEISTRDKELIINKWIYKMEKSFYTDLNIWSLISLIVSIFLLLSMIYMFYLKIKIKNLS